MTGKRAIVTGVLVAVVLTLVGCDAVLLRAVEDKIALEETGPPTPGGSGSLTVDEVAAGSVTLSWQAATDDIVDASDLSYQIVFSIANNIATIETAELNGTIGSDWKSDVTSADATGLSILTEYYFNVIVRDLAGNKAIYVVASATTQNDTTNPTPGGNGLLTISDVAEESLTVSWAEGSDDVTSADDLEYGIFVSESDNISTVADAQTNGTQVGSYSPKVVSANITDLTDFVTYYVNVLVRDGVGNLAAYSSTSDTTVKWPRIYWTEQTAKQIRRARLDGSGVELVFETGITTSPFAIDIDIENRRIYWTDNANDAVNVSDMDGSNTTAIIDTSVATPTGIAIDSSAGVVYWSDEGNDMVYSAPVGTSDSDAANHQITNLVGEGIDAPRGIALDLVEDKLYWVEAGASPRVRRSNLDGTVVETVHDVDIVFSYDIDIDQSSTTGFAYWSDPFGGAGSTAVVNRARKNNGSAFAQMVNQNLTVPMGVALRDGITLFWADKNTHLIYSCPASTTGADAAPLEIVNTNSGGPTGIALDD